VRELVLALDDNASMKQVWPRMGKILWNPAGPSAYRDFDAPGDYPGEGRPLAVVVTGVPGSGKTQALGELARRLALKGVTFAGCRQPAVGRLPLQGQTSGSAPGYDLELLGACGTGRWPLARRREPVPITGMPYAFDNQVFELATGAVAQAAQRGVKVVLLDELGRLELDRGEGLAGALTTALGTPGALPVLSMRADRREALVQQLTEQGWGVVWLDAGRCDAETVGMSLEAAVLVGLAARV
jgi:nucleoside-triphosphatase THEP1